MDTDSFVLSRWPKIHRTLGLDVLEALSAAFAALVVTALADMKW